MRSMFLFAVLVGLGVAGTALAQDSMGAHRTFVTELTVSRSDGAFVYPLQTLTKVAPAGQLVTFSLPSLAPDHCSATSTLRPCDPWAKRSLVGTIQASPVSASDFVPPGQNLRLSVNLTTQVGTDTSTARLLTRQTTGVMFQPIVVATEEIANQAVIYTIKVSEPNEVRVLK